MNIKRILGDDTFERFTQSPNSVVMCYITLFVRENVCYVLYTAVFEKSIKKTHLILYSSDTIVCSV